MKRQGSHPWGGRGASPFARGGGGASATSPEGTQMKTGKEASCLGVSIYVVRKVKWFCKSEDNFEMISCFSLLVPLKKGGRIENIKVSVSFLINTLSF